MGSLSRKQWPDFMTHAVAALNMGWSLEDSKPSCGSVHISSSGKNEVVKIVPHMEIEWLSDEDGDFDPPQKPLHSTLTSEPFHRRGRSFLQRSRVTLLACVPKTRWTIRLQIILATQVLLCAAFEAQIGREILSHSVRSPWYIQTTEMVAVQLATLVFESCYQFVLGLNATRMCNIITTIGICINNISMLVVAILSGVGIDQELNTMKSDVEEIRAQTYRDDDVWREVEALTLIRPGAFRKGFGGLVGTLGLCTLLLSFVTYKLYRQFAWDIYRHIATADRPMRRRYLMYEIYISLLHLDFFFLLGFWLQTLPELEAATLLIGAPVLCVAPFQFFFAGRLVRREKKWGSILTAFLLMAEMALIPFLLTLLKQDRESRNADESDDRAIMRTLAYACLVLLSLAATLVMTIACTINFGKGLEPYLKRNQVTADKRVSIKSSKRANGFGDGFEYQKLSKPAPVRMEID